MLPANVLASRSHSVLPASGKSTGNVATSGRCNCGGGGNGDCAPPPAAKSLSARGLVLVLGDADSGYRNCAGWIAGPRRSLHVSSADRIILRARLVDLGSDEIVATAKNSIERCRHDRPRYVVDLIVETNEPLARHRNIMATDTRGHAGQRCGARRARRNLVCARADRGSD